MKIPPRTMFMTQVVATTFSCFIQIAVLNFALGNIDQVCELHQPERFTCPGGRVFFAGKFIQYDERAQLIEAGPAKGIVLHDEEKDLTRKSTSISFGNLGSYRSWSHLLTRQYLFWTILVLCSRRHRSHHLLRGREEMAKVTSPVSDCSSHIRWSRGYTSGHSA